MPPHILVVEDSATQARVVQRVLESAGYEIELARSGEEGLALFDAERCDAVISDVVMPGAIDGYELCRRIKGSESGRATPVMLLTSLSSPMDIISGLAAGADNFLTKPYDAAHLVERVQVLLRTREARASHKPRVGVEVYFMGQTFNITSDREQILDLLISTFEDAVRQNHALREREQELSEARAQLARHADTLEARLESVLRSVPDVLFSMGGERFSVQYVSPASVRVTGHTPEEFTNDGDLWMRIVHEEDRPALEAALLRVRGGAVANEQFRMRHRDGEDRWIQATFVAVLNPRGQVVQIDGIARDVTAAKRLENRLRTSERRFQGLFESAPEALIITDPRGTIVLANEQAERTFGWTRQELVGQPVEMLMPAGNRHAHLALREGYQRDAVARTMGAGSQNLRGVRKNGKEFPVEISLSPLESDGELLTASAVRDITERKQLEAQLLQAQKMESVGRLAGGVAHDFNNLLSVILGWTGMVLEELPADHAARPSLEEVLRAGEGAAGLTRQLLAFSRQQLVEPTFFNPNALVLELDKMFRRLIGEDIQLVTRTEPELGAVRMDRGQLEQVLMNLVVNARDAMPEGGKIAIETANVTLDADYPRTHQGVTPGEYVMIAVSDSGVGMSDEVKTRLFEPFFTTKESGKGTGLGLATSYGIAQQAGGHIGVYSEPGVGTTMKVYLPRRDEAAAITSARVERSSNRGAETILLVEDEPAVRLVSARMLETQGYRVLLANTGEEALRLLEAAREPVHLLLTDVVLAGGMSGRVLAERVRDLRPGFKVLFVSGYTSDVTILHGLLEKGITLVQKPFTAESLGGKVREVLDAK
jgi:hypothetical protein